MSPRYNTPSKRQAWRNSPRRDELHAVKEWPILRMQVRQRSGGRCEHVSSNGQRCSQPATEVDHKLGRDEHSVDALQDLCHEHHARKTAAESRAARLAKRRKGARERTDRHPGLLD